MKILDVVGSTFAFIILLFIFSVLPVFSLNDLPEPTQTGKYFAFFILIFSLLVVMLLQVHKARIEISIIDILLMCLIIYISFNRYVIDSYFATSLKFNELFGLSVLYLFLRNIGQRTLYIVLFFALLGGAIQSVYGLLQIYGVLESHNDIFQMTGGFFNPGPYGGYLISVFPIGLGLSLFQCEMEDSVLLKTQTKSKFNQIITDGFTFFCTHLLNWFLFLIVVAVFLSESRSAWLSIIVTSFFLISVKYKVVFKEWFVGLKINGLLVKFVIITVLLILLLIIYLIKKDSANGRILIWEISSKILISNPFFGVGYDNFKVSYMGMQAEYFRENSVSAYTYIAGDVVYTFNEILQFTLENGLLGLILLVMLLYQSFKIANERTNLVVISKAIFVSVLVFSMFSYPTEILPIKVNFVLCLSIISTCSTRMISLNRLPSVILIAPIFLFGYIYQSINIKLYDSYKSWGIASNIFRLSEYKDSIKYFEETYSSLYNNGEFLTQYGKALSISGNHKKALQILNSAEFYSNSIILQLSKGNSYKALGDFRLAEKAYEKAYYMAPGRFYAQYLLVKLYLDNGHFPEALRIATKLLYKQPKFSSPMIKEIKLELQEIVKKINENRLTTENCSRIL
jgi:O-antigen ligase